MKIIASGNRKVRTQWRNPVGLDEDLAKIEKGKVRKKGKRVGISVSANMNRREVWRKWNMAAPSMFRHALPLVLFIVSTCFVHSSTSNSGDDIVSELLSLQARSRSGLVRLDDRTIGRFVDSVSIPRPFSLLIFFDAAHLHEKPELRLPELRQEFSLLASSFIHNNNELPSGSKLFFCDVEFKDSQSIFVQFGVNSLPHIRLVTPDIKDLKDSVSMEQGDLSRLADSMADFVESRTKLSVGGIRRPPPFSNKQVMFFGMAILIWVPFIVKKVLKGQTLLHDSRVLLGFAIIVYFFSVSGAMHNIIRKMPMFLADRNDPTKLTFFYQGSGMQLGTEGFAVGFLYTIVGLLLAFVTHFLVKLENAMKQRIIMVLALIVSFWAVKKVVYLDNWKTGYSIHAYWPSGWI